MGDAVFCSVSNSHGDNNILMIKGIKRSKNNDGKDKSMEVGCLISLILHQSQLIQPWSLDV